MSILILIACSVAMVLLVLGGILQTRRHVNIAHCTMCHSPYECVPCGHNDLSGLCEDCYATSLRDGADQYIHQSVTHNIP